MSSLSFNTSPGRGANAVIPTRFNLSGYDLSVEVADNAGIANPFAGVGQVVYEDERIIFTLTATEVDLVEDAYFRIKADNGEDDFYLAHGTISYVADIPDVVTPDLIDESGYLKEVFVPDRLSETVLLTLNDLDGEVAGLVDDSSTEFHDALHATGGTFSGNIKWTGTHDYTDATLIGIASGGPGDIDADDVPETATRKWMSATEKTSLSAATFNALNSTLVKRNTDASVAFSQVFLQSATPTLANQATRKDYVDALGDTQPTADTVSRRSATGAGNYTAIGLSNTPTAPSHATRKDYVDALVATKADAVHAHTIANITATGTASSTTFLRGDGSWQVPINTTYTVPTQAEAEAGIVTTGRAFSAQRVAQAIAALAPVKSVSGKTGIVTLVKADVGLDQVDNTTDAAKPISTATQTALNGKANSAHTHGVADLTATGTRDATTYLRGDGIWATPPGGAGGGTVTAANITDATAIGRTIITSTDAAAVRAAIGAGTSNLALGTSSTTASAGDHTHADLTNATALGTPNTLVKREGAGNITVNAVYLGGAQPTDANSSTRKDYVDAQVATKANTTHTHTASQISDATTIGRSVLTAVDGPAIRTAIGAGTSSLAIGTTSTTAKAGDYQPTAANISDATTIGRTVLTSVDAAAVRTAIGAGTSNLAIGTTSTTAKAGDYAPPSDGAAGVATMRTLGTGATQAAAGNDSRLSDARTPTTHTHTASQISDATTIGRSVLTSVDAAAVRTAIGAGTSSLVIGTTGTTAAAGNDSRLSDARTPVAHTHGVTDLTATGTKDATTFLRGDNTWATPSGGSAPTYANVPAGTTITVMKSGGVWPARPTSRTDIVVAWKGADPDPAIGGTGMVDNVDYRLVTP